VVVVCRHCGSSIKLSANVAPLAPAPPSETTGKYGSPPANRPQRSELASVTLGPEDVKHVIQLIREQQRITAIQFYQDKVGGSLGEAKEAIEAIEAGLKDASAPLPPASATAQPPRMEEIIELVQAGQRLEAIKLYRELTGVGLRESLTVIEGIERQRGRARAAGRPRWLISTGRGSCLAVAGIVVAFILLILGGCGVYLQTKPVYSCSIEAVKEAVVAMDLLQPPVQAGYLVLTPGFEESSGFRSWRLDAEYFAPVWGEGGLGLAYVSLTSSSSGYSAMAADLYLGGDRYELRPWGELPCP
jgi:ribosomal protein L7/L12